MKTVKARWRYYSSAVASVSLFAMLFLAACASNNRIDNFYLNPADGEQAVYTHEGLTVAARYLDETDRTRYLRASGREGLAREIGMLPLSTFVIEVVNKSDSEVIVDPAGIRFITGAGPRLSPVSYAHLYMALPEKEGRQVVLQELQGTTLDRPVTVKRGGREEGLIFFQRPESVSRVVAVVLGGLYLGGAQLEAALTFEAIPIAQ